ncbi:MmgE/PrpD family protein [Rhizobium leguminosarum]|uniref:MmgE/PrpD family protein n=1 Tax=Rhizobium leguminosarum TaxID=384 RepID=UPI001CDB917C|nr:MmgE/PrpD family protein [Rhizobium leguminosarum]MCA2411276.1 MmgE/PrpD family protein [Rhizobium leguminosarum]
MTVDATTLAFANAIDTAAQSYSDDDRKSGLMNFIDGLAAGYAGFRRPEMKMLLESSIVDLSATHPAWLIGSPLRCRPSDAVLLNAMAAHLDDFDDDEAIVSIAHVTVPTMTAVLAAAATQAVSGSVVLDGYLSGVETMVALGELLNPKHYALGWHASATLGVFGAAMAAAHVLGLTAKEKATALGFAVTASSGTRSAFGSSAKPWQVAAAARDGFNAVLLARAGLDANASLFGRMGLAELYGGDPGRINAVFSRLGRGSPFISPGVTIKAYPCCTAAHTAMEACELIRERAPNMPWQDIVSVTVDVGRTIPSILVHNTPRTALEGKFSMQYCAAVALCLPSADLTAFTNEQLVDPAIRHVIERVEMRGLPEQNDPFLCKVTVTLTDGASFTEIVERTKGSPGKPFKRIDIQRKFLSLCGGPGGGEAFEHLYGLPSAANWDAFERHLASLLKTHRADA